MNPTDILLSIAIVGIYTVIYIYLQSQFKNDKIRLKLFAKGFICNYNNWISLLLN